jgi:hypothetical protein
MSELTVGQLKGLTVNNNVITVPSGHTLYAPGSIVQVVNVDNLTRTSQGFTANVILDIANLEATITPRRANSKIIIQARWYGEFNPQGASWDTIFGVSRNGVQVGRQTDPGATVISGISPSTVSYTADDASSTPEVMHLFTHDFPGSTAPVTYKITLVGNPGGTIFTNRTVGWANQVNGHELGTSSIMLMEVAV